MTKKVGRRKRRNLWQHLKSIQLETNFLHRQTEDRNIISEVGLHAHLKLLKLSARLGVDLGPLVRPWRGCGRQELHVIERQVSRESCEDRLLCSIPWSGSNMTDEIFTPEEAARYSFQASVALRSASSSDDERAEACELAGAVLVSFHKSVVFSHIFFYFNLMFFTTLIWSIMSGSTVQVLHYYRKLLSYTTNQPISVAMTKVQDFIWCTDYHNFDWGTHWIQKNRSSRLPGFAAFLAVRSARYYHW